MKKFRTFLQEFIENDYYNNDRENQPKNVTIIVRHSRPAFDHIKRLSQKYNATIFETKPNGYGSELTLHKIEIPEQHVENFKQELQKIDKETKIDKM